MTTYKIDYATSPEGPKSGEPPYKTQITLSAKTTYDNLASIKLFGKGSPNYGEGQQEGVLRILENFASATSPANPTVGQLWWKVTPVGTAERPILMVCDQTSPAISWVPVNGPTIRVAYNFEYNQLVQMYQEIVGAVNTSALDCWTAYGWGQTALAASVAKRFLPAQPVTNNDWLLLLNKWKEIAPLLDLDWREFDSTGFIIDDHLRIHDSGIESKGIGSIIDDWQRAKSAAKKGYDNRFNFSPYYLDLVVYTAINRASYWTNETSLTLDFQWTSGEAMLQYFNTGGYLSLIPSLTSPVDDATTNLWVKMFNGINTINIKACKTDDSNTSFNFSTGTSIFAVLSPLVTLYKANEQEVVDGSLGGYGSYGGYGSGGNGNDSDRGWADLTIEAQTNRTTGLLRLVLTFDNETSAQVKGLLRLVVQSRRATSSSWNGIIPSPAPSHPVLSPASPSFT